MIFSALAAASLITGCRKPAPPPAAGGQAMPVAVESVTLAPVPQSDTFVSTIKSRRSATLQPQVEGNLTRINVRSGDKVKSGAVLMEIDPLKQTATVQQQEATEHQMLAVYQYNQVEVERQRKLYAAGVTSRDSLDQAEQSFANSKAAYESAVAQTSTQREELKYYQIRAPFDGMVGDIPVHVGDYVSASTVLTTVDEISQLEAYIYIPSEKASQLRMGLPVEILDNSNNLLESTSIDFISPEVDTGLQGILAKAPVHGTSEILRNAQLVKARVIWSKSPAPVVPVLAVTRIGGQTFVFTVAQQGGHSVAHQTAVELGDTIGNTYPVLKGLNPGDQVIVSGIQLLAEGAPVQPLHQ
jgi:RND family efflux transporter MFP subunit